METLYGAFVVKGAYFYVRPGQTDFLGPTRIEERARAGLEAGPLSQWLYAGLTEAGFETTLMETRHVKAALSAMRSKDWCFSATTGPRSLLRARRHTCCGRMTKSEGSPRVVSTNTRTHILVFGGCRDPTMMQWQAAQIRAVLVQDIRRDTSTVSCPGGSSASRP